MSDDARAHWTCVTRAARVPRGAPLGVNVGGVQLVLVRTSVGLRCFEGLCPHQGAALAEGAVHGDVLLCPKHRWRFDPQGRRMDGPGCLRSYRVKELDGDVWVDLYSPVSSAPGSSSDQGV